MSRLNLAFLIAPLWVPVLLAVFAGLSGTSDVDMAWLPVVGFLATTAIYVACFIVGRPLYALVLRWRPLSFRSALAIGACIGIAFFFAYLTGLMVLAGRGLDFLAPFVSPTHLLIVAKLLAGPVCLGVLISATIWAIARPDRMVRAEAG